MWFDITISNELSVQHGRTRSAGHQSIKKNWQKDKTCGRDGLSLSLKDSIFQKTKTKQNNRMPSKWRYQHRPREEFVCLIREDLWSKNFVILTLGTTSKDIFCCLFTTLNHLQPCNHKSWANSQCRVSWTCQSGLWYSSCCHFEWYLNCVNCC